MSNLEDLVGVVHKLKPEIIKFIIENKQTNLHLSCRNLSVLLQEKLQVKVSKSSINDIFKSNSLSMPVGRRQKPKKKKFNMPVLPVIEEKVKEEIIEKQEKELLRKAEDEQAAKQKELARIRSEEEAKFREEQERSAQVAESKTEQERWQHLAEEEHKKEETPRAGEVVKEGHKIGVLSVLPLSRECTGAVLLKAIDYLVGGSTQLIEAIKKGLGYPQEDIEALTHALIFHSIVGDDFGALSSLVGKEITSAHLSAYLALLQKIKTMKLDLSRMTANIFNEARGIKMHFIDANTIYLDAQMHTVWSTSSTPYNFSATALSVQDRVNRYFLEDGNFVLFMAPGYDIPTKEFFILLHNYNLKHKTADKLILYNNKLDELETIVLNPGQNRNLLFGLWPWQFTAYRKIKRIGDFSLNHIDCMNKDYYLAEIEIELMEPVTKQSSLLKGCAIKLDLAEKIRLVVLSIDPAESLVSLAKNYLCRWPNLDESFQDFSRKIELFTYAGESQKFFSYENLPTAKREPPDLKSVFSGYAEALDAYLRWHFMPAGYEKIELKLTKDRFYNQKAQVNQDKNWMHCSLIATRNYAYAKEMEYICRRFNERDIHSFGKQKVWFESVFK